MRDEDKLLKKPGMKGLKTLIPPLDPSEHDITVDSLLPFHHDPIPEHHFDESTFSICPSKEVD